jgi:hypothetical protein
MCVKYILCVSFFPLDPPISLVMFLLFVWWNRFERIEGGCEMGLANAVWGGKGRAGGGGGQGRSGKEAPRLL